MFLLPLRYHHHLFLRVLILFFLLLMRFALIYSKLLQLGSAHPLPWSYGFTKKKKKKPYSSQRNHIYSQNHCLASLQWPVWTSVPCPILLPSSLYKNSRNFWKAEVFLKNLCQIWFPVSLSPCLSVMVRFFHQLLLRKQLRTTSGHWLVWSNVIGRVWLILSSKL